MVDLMFVTQEEIGIDIEVKGVSPRPSILWVKVNTDGLSKKNPGLSACGGGIIEDCFLVVLLCFWDSTLPFLRNLWLLFLLLRMLTLEAFVD